MPLEPVPDYTTGRVHDAILSTYSTILPYFVLDEPTTGTPILVVEQSLSTSLSGHNRSRSRTSRHHGLEHSVRRQGPDRELGEDIHGRRPDGQSARAKWQFRAVRELVHLTNPWHRHRRRRRHVSSDYLYLVNGIDDDGNGVIDDGHNGLGLPRKRHMYYETEKRWGNIPGSRPAGLRSNQTTLHDPAASVAVAQRPRDRLAVERGDRPDEDGSLAASTPERSPSDPALPRSIRTTGYVDILVNPDGTIVPTTSYSRPSSSGMDVCVHPSLAGRAERPAASDLTQSNAPYLPVPQGLAPQPFARPARSRANTGW